MKRYLCLGCGFLYDKALGPAGVWDRTWNTLAGHYGKLGLARLRHTKSLFEMVEIGY